MINLKLEDHCDGCPDFEPAAVKYFAGSEIHHIDVRCEHEARCMNIAKHIENQIKGGKPH